MPEEKRSRLQAAKEAQRQRRDGVHPSTKTLHTVRDSKKQGSYYVGKDCIECGARFQTVSGGRKRCFSCSPPAKTRVRDGKRKPTQTYKDVVGKEEEVKEEKEEPAEALPEDLYLAATPEEVLKVQGLIARQVAEKRVSPLQGEAMIRASMSMMRVLEAKAKMEREERRLALAEAKERRAAEKEEKRAAAKAAVPEVEEAAAEEGMSEEDESDLEELAGRHGLGKEEGGGEEETKRDGEDRSKSGGGVSAGG